MTIVLPTTCSMRAIIKEGRLYVRHQPAPPHHPDRKVYENLLARAAATQLTSCAKCGEVSRIYEWLGLSNVRYLPLKWIQSLL
jgi:hypothetical protein